MMIISENGTNEIPSFFHTFTSECKCLGDMIVKYYVRYNVGYDF